MSACFTIASSNIGIAAHTHTAHRKEPCKHAAYTFGGSPAGGCLRVHSKRMGNSRRFFVIYIRTAVRLLCICCASLATWNIKFDQKIRIECAICVCCRVVLHTGPN